MKILVGLGNPGKKYQHSRHNTGFMAVDEFVKKNEFAEFHEDKNFFAEITEGQIGGEKIICAKPLTYMNESGQAVRALRDFYKLESADVLVIYDDIDLPLGTFRIRNEGSAGTHNGMKSIIEHLVTEKFPRLRIGIENRDADHKQDLTNFVLGNFAGKEKEVLSKTITEALEALVEEIG